MDVIGQGERFVTVRTGTAEVTALHDGHVDMPPERLRRNGAEHVPATAALVAGKLRLSVNAFVVKLRNHVVLIDTGAADAWHPTMGNLTAALDEARIAPETVQVVALTHTHIDHVSGLVRPDGALAFPNADIRVPEAERGLFLAEPRVAGLTPRWIAPGDEVVPGITAVAAFGHEVGHTAYLVEGLLIWGDVVHVPSVQFAEPGVTWAFDTDQQAALATRLRLFDRAVDEGLWVAGAHLDFPGIGRVQRAGDAYRFQPL